MTVRDLAPLARRAAWPLAVVAVVLLVFAPALGGERTLARRDAARQVGPPRVLIASALREGRLPLWNPHEGAGKPLFAEGIHSTLHPVSIAGALLAPRSLDFLLVGYLIFAGLGAFALARTLGAAPSAAAAAGVAYATCGFSVSMTGNPVFLAGGGALAWMLAAARHAGGGGRFGGAACAVATAVGFFSGDVQATILGGAIGVALAVDAGGWRALPRVAAGLAAGALLAGVQTAASWGFLQETVRADGVTAGDRLQWALHPARVIEWFVPGLARGDLAGDLQVDLLGGPDLYGPFAESIYLGAPLLLLGGIGICACRPRLRWVLTGLLVTLAWIAMGHHLGARGLLDLVPVWNRFRFNEKMMASISLIACAAAALGIERFGRDRLPRAAVVAAGLVVLLAGGGLAVILVAPDAGRRVLAQVSAEGPEGGAFLLDNLRTGLLHAALGAFALLALDRFPVGARGPAAAALLAVSTSVAVPFGVLFGRQAAQEAPVPFALEAAPPGPRLAHPVRPEFPGSLGGDLDLTDTAVLLERTALWPSWNVAERIDAISGYSGLPPRRLDRFEYALGPYRWAAARRFGVTHVVVGRSGAGSEPEVAMSIAGGTRVFAQQRPPLEVWAVPHRPWAFFASTARTAPGPNEAAGVVAELAFRGDPGAVVVEAAEAPATAPGRVLALRRGTEDVQVVAEASSPGLLVLGDAFWPGWRGWVDGVEAPIVAADLLVRAVRWPAGRHTLVMRYDPPEVRVGWALSGLGLLATAALALGDRFRRSRQP